MHRWSHLNSRHLLLHVRKCSIRKPHVTRSTQDGHSSTCRMHTSPDYSHTQLLHQPQLVFWLYLASSHAWPVALTKALEQPPFCRAVQIGEFMLCQVSSIHSRLPVQQAQRCLQSMRLEV